jgi:hypothetical protein
MNNSQMRMLGSAIVVVGGAIDGVSDNLSVNVSLIVIILGMVMFIAEYVRSARF